jgi:hypothetical protein
MIFQITLGDYILDTNCNPFTGPRFLPVALPNLPVALPNLPVALPNLPVGPPNLPV